MSHAFLTTSRLIATVFISSEVGPEDLMVGEFHFISDTASDFAAASSALFQPCEPPFTTDEILIVPLNHPSFLQPSSQICLSYL